MRKLDTRTIVVASHNKGKIAEIADLIRPFGFSAKSAAELNFEEPDETGTTFEENAAIKALASAKASGLPALSDDSGLVIDALDGAPGVYTANWAETADGTRDFAMAMRKVEDALAEHGASKPDDRTARFVSVLCLAWPTVMSSISVARWKALSSGHRAERADLAMIRSSNPRVTTPHSVR